MMLNHGVMQLRSGLGDGHHETQVKEQLQRSRHPTDFLRRTRTQAHNTQWWRIAAQTPQRTDTTWPGDRAVTPEVNSGRAAHACLRDPRAPAIIGVFSARTSAGQ